MGIDESQVTGDEDQFPLFLKARRQWRHHAGSKRQPWWPSDPNPPYFDLLSEYVFEQQACRGYGHQPLPSTSTPASPSLAAPTPTLPKSPAPKEVFIEKVTEKEKEEMEEEKEKEVEEEEERVIHNARPTRSDLTKHALTPKHVENINCSKKSGSYQEIVIEGPSLKERTTVVEYKTAQFIAVHPVSILLVDELVPFMQELTLKDPEAVQQMKMKHTKCTGIIKDVLYKSAFSEIVDILNEVLYSVLVDESTDVSNTKLFCISVQYYSFRLEKSVQHFLSFVELDPLNSKAPDLFESFRKFFIESKISLNNLIAVSSDNAKTGTKNSFYTNLRDVVPNAISLNCICHSMALIAKSSTNSTSKTLKSVEDLARDISGYFCKSPKRTEELSAKLKFHELPDTKILRLSGTRWLEGYHVFDRILNHWPALIDFFDEECNSPSKNKSSDKPSQLPKPSKKVSTIKPPKEIKPTKAKIILEAMNDVSNQAYMYFFKYVLKFFNVFNATFQSRDLKIHTPYNDIKVLINRIASNFIKKESLPRVLDQDFDVESNCRSVEDVYFGPSIPILNEKQKLSVESLSSVRDNCLNFYKQALKGMRIKLLEHRNLLSSLVFLEPKYALDSEKREEIANLSGLCNEFFPFIDLEIAFEWRTLPSYFDSQKKQII
ncbi:hypothetical protein TKK_0005291 [Trichogramma kaykai]|uniref:DUF4371 domain-containing protein n=1 Tax=Trichogramma kaykai TaxID=54128 RepID=A0ABD2XJJ2_9HYME